MLKHIYFLRPIGQNGPIKIGCSVEPPRRLLEMQMWSPIPLELIATCRGTHANERHLHAAFAEQRLHFEWFRESADLYALIDLVKSGRTIEEILGNPPLSGTEKVRIRVLAVHRGAAA